MADKIKIKFYKGTSQQYNNITPDEFTFYYLTDLKRFYLGTNELTNQNVLSQLQDAIVAINQRINEIDGGGGSGDNYTHLIVKSTAEWKTNNPITNIPWQDQISNKNTIYVYSDRGPHYNIDGDQYSLPGIKIGDGLAYIKSLPYIDQYINILYQRINDIDTRLTNHINDQERHITENERQFWNNKINCYYEDNLVQQVTSDGTLIFTRNNIPN